MSSPPEPGPASAKIFVRALTVQAEIGVHRHERGRRQPLVVDVERGELVAHFAEPDAALVTRRGGGEGMRAVP